MSTLWQVAEDAENLQNLVKAYEELEDQFQDNDEAMSSLAFLMGPKMLEASKRLEESMRDWVAEILKEEAPEDEEVRSA